MIIEKKKIFSKDSYHFLITRRHREPLIVETAKGCTPTDIQKYSSKK